MDIQDLQHLQHVQIPTSLALAILATLGYVFGTLAQRRKANSTEAMMRLKKDLTRAKTVVNDLGKVIRTVRSSANKHYARLQAFQKRLTQLNAQRGDAAWEDLCREIESILDPTLQLVGEIGIAQERIRYQSNYLMTFSESQTDPLTGLGNRRAMDHVLSTQLSLLSRYGTPFSLAILDIDCFKTLNDEQGHLYGDQMLRDLSELLADTLRTADIVARYGGDEFVIVAPHTDLVDARSLGERLRLQVEQKLPFTISIGVASANETDTPDSLFHRADNALYRAKTAGRNHICCDPPLVIESSRTESDHGETDNQSATPAGRHDRSYESVSGHNREELVTA